MPPKPRRTSGNSVEQEGRIQIAISALRKKEIPALPALNQSRHLIGSIDKAPSGESESHRLQRLGSNRSPHRSDLGVNPTPIMAHKPPISSPRGQQTARDTSWRAVGPAGAWSVAHCLAWTADDCSRDRDQSHWISTPRQQDLA
jgi:hypothetical protein